MADLSSEAGDPRSSSERGRGWGAPLPDCDSFERTVNSSAPIRICDLGGWTDTWFAVHGCVLNMAVTPRVTVQVHAKSASRNSGRLSIHAPDLGLHCDAETSANRGGGKQLLEAAVRSVDLSPARDLEVWVGGGAPPGSSTGTSAATCVALLGALLRLKSNREVSAEEISSAAHRVETELLGQQSGVQDQLAASYGGVSFIEIRAYPDATVTSVVLPDPLYWDLEQRLSLVFVGESHDSSAVHDLVIERLRNAGSEAQEVVRLRELALYGRDALLAGDLKAFGEAMVQNTETQSLLHPELVGPHHQKIIAIAKRAGAWGWKVNGAGGRGGSITILHSPQIREKHATLAEIAATNPRYRTIAISLSASGLCVWEPSNIQANCNRS